MLPPSSPTVSQWVTVYTDKGPRREKKVWNENFRLIIPKAASARTLLAFPHPLTYVQQGAALGGGEVEASEKMSLLGDDAMKSGLPSP